MSFLKVFVFAAVFIFTNAQNATDADIPTTMPPTTTAMPMVTNDTDNATTMVQTTIPECNTTEADIVFLLDSSNSLGYENFQEEIRFLSNIVSSIEIGPDAMQVGLLVFESDIRLEFYLNQYTNATDILEALNIITWKPGNTFTDKALTFAMDQMFTIDAGDRPDARNVIVLVTDGQSTDPNKTLEVADLLHNSSNIEVITIGVGNLIDIDELDAIASSKDYSLELQEFRELPGIVSDIGLKTTGCNVTTPVPPSTTQYTTPTSTETRTPPTTPLPTTASLPCNETIADIAFLMDSSNSMGLEQFEIQKQFVINVTEEFDIGPNKSQISLVTFASDVQLQFYLNTYEDKQAVIEAINNTIYTPGNTMTDKALVFAQSNIFQPENGDRPDVPNFIVLTTDGESTNKNATMQEAERLNKNDNITVFTVAIGDYANHDELNALASRPGFNLTVDNFEQLRTLVDVISPVTLCPTPYVPLETTASCYVQKADIVFMLDSSNSVGVNDFEREKSFVSDVINRFETGPDNIQIAAITFESNPHAMFFLNQYENKSDILTAVHQIQFKTGNTLTGKAIRFVMDIMFQNTTGDREDAENILVILTDGRSTDENNTMEEAEALKNTSVTVFTIGIGRGVDQDELKMLATDANHQFLVGNFEALTSIENEIDVSMTDCRFTSPTTSPPTTMPSTTIESCDQRQADIVFLLDSSNSQGLTSFNLQKDFVKNFARNVLIGPDHVLISVTTFASDVVDQFDLDQYQNFQDLIQAIDQIPYKPGNTFTGRAIQYAINTSLSAASGARPNVDDYIIVLTDGKSTDPNETLAVAEEIHNTSVTVIAIGVGFQVDDNELYAIASSPDDVFKVPTFQALNGILDLLGNTTCLPTPSTTETTTTTEPKKTTPPITAPPKTTAITVCAIKKLDLMFMMDSSNSEGPDNFNLQKSFVYNIAQRYEKIGPNDVQVGLITFASDVHNQFNLSTYHSRSELLNAITRVPYTPGNTITGAAINYIRTQSFSAAAGDRADADNILIVLTDGQSTDKNDTAMEAMMLHNSSDMKVIAIGIGADVDVSELEEIGSAHQEVFAVPDFNALRHIQQEVENAACVDMSVCEDMVDCVSMGEAICMRYDSYARRNCARYCGYCH